jgi:hypothetical protein
MNDYSDLHALAVPREVMKADHCLFKRPGRLHNVIMKRCTVRVEGDSQREVWMCDGRKAFGKVPIVESTAIGQHVKLGYR